MGTPPARVAVVGSGVAGLTAAYVASRTAHVTLFEADDRLGGHADTHRRREVARWRPRARHRHRLHRAQPAHLPGAAPAVRRARRRDPAVGDVDVDPRRRHRPRVGRRARSPGPVPDLAPTCATRATSRCSPRSRGSTAGPGRIARRPRAPTSTLREFLDEGRFSAYFVRHFMEPLVAAVWSCDPEVALDYPARYLFTFLEHHGMLGVFGSPQWRTVTGGSQAYVAKVAAASCQDGPHRHQGHLGPRDGRRGRGHRRQRRRSTTYDAVVVATHPGQALAMLAEPTAAQREVLAAMPYSPQHRAAAHRHLGDAARRRRLGVLELPAACRLTATASPSPTTSPGCSGSTPRRTTSSRSAARTSSTRPP